MTKIFFSGKDGGQESNVWGHFFEIKKLFTAALLRFENGTREAYHNHAFNCISIVLGPGHLEEIMLDGAVKIHKPGKVLITKRDDFHKVFSHGRTWVLTFRGPWKENWEEYIVGKGFVTLTNGRRIVSEH